MTQSWNPTAYAEVGAFVPTLGAGVLEWLAPQAGERILDLGCGDGQLTARIAASGAEVVGVDRALKPGGRFGVEMGGHGNVAAILVALTAVLEKHRFASLEDGVNYYPTPESYAARLVRHGFHVEQIQLIPRPTPLSAGMAAWLTTFRSGGLAGLPEALRPIVVEETVALLKPFLCDEQGNWTGDYVRLRFVARA